MKGLRDEMNRNGVAASAEIKVIQPHSESGAYLYRTIDKGKWYTLSLYHSEATAWLGIEASQKRLATVEERLGAALEGVAPLRENAKPGLLVVWRQKFAEPYDIAPREEFLREQAVPLFDSIMARID